MLSDRIKEKKKAVQYSHVTEDAKDRLEALELQEHSFCSEEHGIVLI